MRRAGTSIFWSKLLTWNFLTSDDCTVKASLLIIRRIVGRITMSGDGEGGGCLQAITVRGRAQIDEIGAHSSDSFGLASACHSIR